MIMVFKDLILTENSSALKITRVAAFLGKENGLIVVLKFQEFKSPESLTILQTSTECIQFNIFASVFERLKILLTHSYLEGDNFITLEMMTHITFGDQKKTCRFGSLVPVRKRSRCFPKAPLLTPKRPIETFKVHKLMVSEVKNENLQISATINFSFLRARMLILLRRLWSIKNQSKEISICNRILPCF